MEENIKDVEFQEVKEESIKEKPLKTPEVPKKRQIVIETDGDSINLLKAEVSGKIELVAILQNIIGFLNRPQ